MHTCMQVNTAFLNEVRMYNKNGCGHGCGLSIGVWHVGVLIMVPETGSKKLRPMHACGKGGLLSRLHAGR